MEIPCQTQVVRLSEKSFIVKSDKCEKVCERPSNSYLVRKGPSRSILFSCNFAWLLFHEQNTQLRSGGRQWWRHENKCTVKSCHPVETWPSLRTSKWLLEPIRRRLFDWVWTTFLQEIEQCGWLVPEDHRAFSLANLFLCFLETWEICRY